MRTANINVRVEPQTSRGLTWAINKYNFENCEKFTKTDVIELLIEGFTLDSDLLKICLFLQQGLNLEEAAATAKGHNYKPIQLKAEANADYGKIIIEGRLKKELQGRISQAVGQQHQVKVTLNRDGAAYFYKIYIDSFHYTLYEKNIEFEGFEACVTMLINLYHEDLKAVKKAYKEGETHADTSTINQDSSST